MSDPSRAEVTPIPVVAVLGTDAVLAARPATPVQLAHACLAAGYSAVYPASWGDELLARHSLERLQVRADAPAIICSCPLVAERLLTVGDELEPYLLPLVSPPVAVSRYLRAIYGEDGVHITYVGGCPSAADPAIDLQLAPADLMSALQERGLVLSEQPRVFNSVIPPDRRRYYSLPGGTPLPEWVERSLEGGSMVVLEGEDYATELAQRLIAAERVVIDAAPCLGCLCSGATAADSVSAMRQVVATIEPPRAPSPVVDAKLAVELDVESARALVPPVTEEWDQGDLEPRSEAPDDTFGMHDDVAPNHMAEPAMDAPMEISKPVEISKEVRVANRPKMIPWDEDLASWDPRPVSVERHAKQHAEQRADQPAEPTVERESESVADSRGAEETSAESEPVDFPPLAAPLAGEGNGQAHTPRERRFTPASVRRFSLQTPVVRTEEGRVLPRAYIVQRRTPAPESQPAAEPSRPAMEPAPAERPERSEWAEPPEVADRERLIDRAVEPRAPAAADLGETDDAAWPPEEPDSEAPAEASADLEREVSVVERTITETTITETTIAETMIAEAPAEAPVDEPTEEPIEESAAQPIEAPPAGRTSAPPVRSIMIPLPTDRPQPIPPPPVKDRSGLMWALLALAVVAIAVVVVWLLTGAGAQRMEPDTAAPVLPAVTPVAQPAAGSGIAPATAMGVPATDSISAGALPDSVSPPRDSAALLSDSLAPPATAAGDSATSRAPDTARAPRPARTIVSPAPPGRAAREAARRAAARRRGFDSLARIVDSLVPR